MRKTLCLYCYRIRIQFGDTLCGHAPFLSSSNKLNVNKRDSKRMEYKFRSLYNHLYFIGSYVSLT